MFQMNVNTMSQRYVQYDGMLHYYKYGWLSNKWTVVYAKLWSDSTLEWYHSKGSTKPIDSIVLGSVIPYICIGPHVRKIPSKKPRIEATWTRELLMAIGLDQKASTVHWFYFDNGNYLRTWLSKITQTLPRLNQSAPQYSNQAAYQYPRQNNVINNGSCFGRMQAPLSMMMNDGPQRRQVSFNDDSQRRHRRRNSFDSLFDETMLNYGLGNSFFSMSSNRDSSDSDWSSDSDEVDSRRGRSTVFGDDNIHVQQFGDATAITLRTGSDRDSSSNRNEFGDGFGKVHHFEL